MITAEQCVRIATDCPAYPALLRERLGPEAPAILTARGNPELLQLPLLALFCSVQLPPELVLGASDLARALRDGGAAVISGFHAPVERECLDLLLRGAQPVVACPARGIEGMRLPRAWRAALAEGRLLLLSRHTPRHPRPTGHLAEARNRVVAALAKRVFIVHASAGGRLHRLAAEVAARGQPLACFAHPANADLVLLGARALPVCG